jgi:protein O-GlcNAc transferase
MFTGSLSVLIRYALRCKKDVAWFHRDETVKKKCKMKIPASPLFHHEEDPASHYHSGVVLFNNRQYDEAIVHFQKALELNPSLVPAYNYLGSAFYQKKQVNESVKYYQKAIQVNPADPAAYMNLGVLFHNGRQHEKAISCFQAALRFNPNLYQAYDYMGLMFTMANNIDKAVESYQSSLLIKPDSDMALVNLGNLIAVEGKLNEAEDYYKRALQINPDNIIAHEAFVCNMPYNPHYDEQTIFSEHRRVAEKFAEPLSVFVLPHINDRSVSRTLRIGYFSPDFKRHPVAYFIEPILAAHNRDTFEVFCYSNGGLCDDTTERIRNAADQWRNISELSDENAAEAVRRDRIDILVDLAGHTDNNRILLFARKPAPVQVTWIGYPATTGLTTMDYKIVDHYTDPPGRSEQYYSEKLIRLPESFLSYLPDRDSPEAGPLPALTKGHITFGSFNNFKKVRPEAFELWANILNSLPDSCFMLKSIVFSDKNICRYTTDMFMRRGISAERITLLPWVSSTREHLACYHEIDIGLDTFPYNGTTTTCEAMWMGVPVITLQGNTHASRVGASLLSNAGVPDLIAKTTDDYLSTAVNLAKDLERLQSLRDRLRNMMMNSPLCNAKKLTMDLEVCYRKMWERWCRSG